MGFFRLSSLQLSIDDLYSHLLVLSSLLERKQPCVVEFLFQTQKLYLLSELYVSKADSFANL